ncbi:transglutaminase-like cysteine peptidase [Sphingomonas sp. RB1R13]|uniref:transglutaminase-like cysteine peptidase n=1 Tax=Sphingomonas sp. RB1R13 TaxID=3096159 RepID=UPI002FCC4CBF
MEKTSLRSALRALTAGLALAAAPTVANAQDAVMQAASFSVSKGAAILGSMSALDRLLAQQGATPAAPTLFHTATVAASDVSAPSLIIPAVIRGQAAAISSDRPDVFNSVAMPIGWSPLEGRWQRVAHGAPDAPAARFAASLTNRDAFHRLEAVNLYVNRRVHFVDDAKQYGVADYWAPAAQTLARGRGDCEDYAIAKLALLRRAGFAEHDLYLVIAHDLVRRQDHAVAVARVDGKLWLLDSGTDELLDASQAHDYRPVFSFSGARSWTHGYRRELAPMTIAAAPVTAVQMASR